MSGLLMLLQRTTTCGFTEDNRVNQMMLLCCACGRKLLLWSLTGRITCLALPGAVASGETCHIHCTPTVGTTTSKERWIPAGRYLLAGSSPFLLPNWLHPGCQLMKHWHLPQQPTQGSEGRPAMVLQPPMHCLKLCCQSGCFQLSGVPPRLPCLAPGQPGVLQELLSCGSLLRVFGESLLQEMSAVWGEAAWGLLQISPQGQAC
jgi:hypothetical protein